MKETERGRIYLCAVYVGDRKEIKKEAQQISIQKDDIYGYIVEPENGRAYGYPTMQDLRRDWKKGLNHDTSRKTKSRTAAGGGRGTLSADGKGNSRNREKSGQIKKRADPGQNHAGSKRRVETSRRNVFGRG